MQGSMNSHRFYDILPSIIANPKCAMSLDSKLNW